MSGHQATLLLLLRRSSTTSSSSSFSSSCAGQTPSTRRSLLQVVTKQNQQQKQFGTTTTTTTTITVTRRQNHHQQHNVLSLSRRYFIQSTKIKQAQPASLLLLESLFGNYYYYYRHGLMNLHTTYLQDNNNKQQSQQQRILACSSTTTTKSNNSLIHRWLQTFKRWLKSLWHACLVTQRIVEVTIKLSPLMILVPISYVTPKSQRISDMTWNYTIIAVQNIGPVAIKFCQWVATRRDIFPPTLCNKLSVLHDKGCPHSWDYTNQILIDAFGENYEQQGLYIDDNDKLFPIGCGSAAQVYKGRLVLKRKRKRTTKEEGKGSDDNNHHSSNADDDGDDDDSLIVEERTVAIKVLHPNFTQQVERDLELIGIIAGYLHSLPSDMIKMINLPRVTENFGTVLKLQADLTNEANNLEKFRYNFYHDRTDVEQQSHITFPRPMNMERWQNTNVLVEDFVHDAVPISEYLKDSSPDGLKLRRELAGPLLRAFLKMVFMDNFVHGDLHPGNVLVKTAKVDSSSPKHFWDFWRSSSSNDIKNVSEEGVEFKHSIVFLDAGIANSLSPEDKRNLKDLFKAVIFNEGYRAGELMVERAHYERCSTVPGGVDAFARGVEDIVSEFHDRRKEGLTLGAVRIGSLLSRVLDLCRIHGVEIDPHMANVVLSTLVLEGLGRSLAPELDLITFAKPFVLGLGKV